MNEASNLRRPALSQSKAGFNARVAETGEALPAQVFSIAAVIAATGFSKASIYVYMRDGRFPRPIRLGARKVGWRSQDIADWLASRPLAA